MASSLGSVIAKLRLRQLALIVATSDAGSLRVGAARSNVSQPAATKMLREAEEALKARIFERTHRGMQTTVAGEAVVAYARAAIADLTALRESLAAIDAGVKGRVRVGSIAAAGPEVMAPAMGSLAQSHPGIEVMVRVDTSSSVIALLLDGQLDLALARPDDNPAFRYLSLHRLKDEKLVVVAGPHHPLRGVRNASAARLRDCSWILHPRGTLLRNAVERAFQTMRVDPPQPMVETTSDVMVVSILQTTSMLAVMPSSVATLYASRKVLRIIATRLPIHLGPFGILLRRGREPSPAAQVLLRYLRKGASAASGGEPGRQSDQ